MKNNKTVVVRVFPKFDGRTPVDAPVIAGLDCDKIETICVYLSKNSNMPNFFSEKTQIRCLYLSNKRNFRFFNLFLLLKLAKIFRSENVDIVHCCCRQSIIYGFFAAKFAKTKSVLGEFDVLDKMFEKPTFIYSFVLENLSKILAIGRFVRTDILNSNSKINPEKVISISHTIDSGIYEDCPISKNAAREKLNLPNDAIVFGAVGKLIEARNVNVLIDSFNTVKRKIHNAHLLIVGDGIIGDKLKKQASEGEFSDAIHFVGKRDDVAVCLKSMDVFVSPAENQGFPQSVLEAMAAQIPCVAVRSGAIPEIFDDGKVGLMVNPSDRDSLAAAMIEILELPHEQVLQMTQNGYERVKKLYSRKAAIKILKDIYTAAV